MTKLRKQWRLACWIALAKGLILARILPGVERNAQAAPSPAVIRSAIVRSAVAQDQPPDPRGAAVRAFLAVHPLARVTVEGAVPIQIFGADRRFDLRPYRYPLVPRLSTALPCPSTAHPSRQRRPAAVLAPHSAPPARRPTVRVSIQRRKTNGRKARSTGTATSRGPWTSTGPT
jgi:hypothetical protein